MIWYHSTLKAGRDALVRGAQLERAVQELSALRQKLLSPRTRYRTLSRVWEAVEQIRGTAVNQVEGAELALATGGPASIPTSALILRK